MRFLLETYQDPFMTNVPMGYSITAVDDDVKEVGDIKTLTEKQLETAVNRVEKEILAVIEAGNDGAVVDAPDNDDEDLDQMKVKELREMAESMGLDPKGLNKAKLIEAIEGAR